MSLGLAQEMLAQKTLGFSKTELMVAMKVLNKLTEEPQLLEEQEILESGIVKFFDGYDAAEAMQNALSSSQSCPLSALRSLTPKEAAELYPKVAHYTKCSPDCKQHDHANFKDYSAILASFAKETELDGMFKRTKCTNHKYGSRPKETAPQPTAQASCHDTTEAEGASVTPGDVANDDTDPRMTNDASAEDTAADHAA